LEGEMALGRAVAPRCLRISEYGSGRRAAGQEADMSVLLKWFIRQVAPFQSCPKLEEP
jgi:hypothetical protein